MPGLAPARGPGGLIGGNDARCSRRGMNSVSAALAGPGQQVGGSEHMRLVIAVD
jgi:hypothetical protein